MRPLVTFVFICLSSLFSINALANKKLEDFANQLADKHQFDLDYVSNILKQANKNTDILESIQKPWEAKPWHLYHPIFLTEKRIDKGVKFWTRYENELKRAEEETGVPAQIIVAILGVESFYGTYLGKYSVLDALYTLGFYYPRRSSFFKKELEEFFLLTREEGFDPTLLKGSYAGAMGWGQFISSSYRHYAIDFDDDGVRDLLNNPSDAIGSVANYFKKHGWKKNQDIAYPATIADDNQGRHQEYISRSLKFKHQWQQLEAAGVIIDSNFTLATDSKVKLLKMDVGQQDQKTTSSHEDWQAENQSYWVALPNFYVITRYNHSPLYAMAVYQLSESIFQRKNDQ